MLLVKKISDEKKPTGKLRHFSVFLVLYHWEKVCMLHSIFELIFLIIVSVGFSFIVRSYRFLFFVQSGKFWLAEHCFIYLWGRKNDKSFKNINSIGEKEKKKQLPYFPKSWGQSVFNMNYTWHMVVPIGSAPTGWESPSFGFTVEIHHVI